MSTSHSWDASTFEPFFYFLFQAFQNRPLTNIKSWFGSNESNTKPASCISIRRNPIWVFVLFLCALFFYSLYFKCNGRRARALAGSRRLASTYSARIDCEWHFQLFSDTVLQSNDCILITWVFFMYTEYVNSN